MIRLTRYRSPNPPQDDGFCQPVSLIPVPVSHTRRTCRLCVWYWWRSLSQHRWMLWVSASEPNPTHSLQLLLCECLHLEPTRMKKINPEPTQEKMTFSEASVTHLDPTRLKQSNIYLLLKSPGKSNILNSTIQSKHCYSARIFTSVLKKQRELCTFSSLPPVC